MPDPGQLLAVRAAALLPGRCFTGSADPARLWPLLPGESVRGMVARRSAEFSAGRHAARLAMAAAGLAPCALPKGADRAPVWPAGVLGSISHSDLACIAAVARPGAGTDLADGPCGIGLDIEPLRPFDPAVAALVTGPEDSVPGDRAAAKADPGLLLFCVKEAAYKAQYPLSRQLFGPETLAVTISGERFRAGFREAVAPFDTGFQIEGRITICAGHVLAVAWIPGRSTSPGLMSG